MGVYIIAEAGVNHNGNIKLAKRLVDMAKECGADAIKFQTFKAEESTSRFANKAEYQKKNDHRDTSQLEMLKNLELDFNAFKVLKMYCENKKIDFISTPDGKESMEFLVQLGVDNIKIGSTEVTNYPFLKQLATTGKRLILSTGMSTLGEVEKAVEVLKENGAKSITLLHCTTNYPTNYDDVNLKAMITLKNAFHLPIGYSDHTLGYETAVAATALGASIIEKHITLSKSMEGPDHKASMEPHEFKQYVRSIRNTEKLLGDGIKKPTKSEINMMPDVRRSILAAEDLKKGTILTLDNVCLKRPGNGISPEYLQMILGRKLKRDIQCEEVIGWEDV